MQIADEYLLALRIFGYTDDEARFLYVVAMHSGCFVPRGTIAARESEQFGEGKGEVNFILPLHRVLHPSLHPARESKSNKTRHMPNRGTDRRDAAQTRRRRERPHPVTHGASRGFVGSLPPHRAGRAIWCGPRRSSEEKTLVRPMIQIFNQRRTQ